MTPYVARHFTPSVDPLLFHCPCGSPTCDALPPAELLLVVLDQVREAYHAPMVVTSGPRCRAHDATLPASAAAVTGHPGAHVLAQAADIEAIDGAARYNLVRAALICGVRRIGLYHAQACVHLDVSPTLPAPSLWVS